MFNKEVREIRACYDETSLVVYQAYNKLIADSAVAAQTFVSPPFKKDRMTWIKPSFFWMMYRSGWATKKDQEHILAIRIKRLGFEWALEHSCLSHFDSSVYSTHEEWEKKKNNSPVRIQWDPERDPNLNQLPQRAIQIGLSLEAVELYLKEWIIDITDVSGECIKIKRQVESGNQIIDLIPREHSYPLTDNIKNITGAT